jgi:hypothetical protein
MQRLFFLIISLSFFHASFAANAVMMISDTTAVTPRNADGTYPVWVSPDLGVKSLSTEDINAALKRKFWDNPAYQRDFPREVEYLKKSQIDVEKLYQLQARYYRGGNKQIEETEFGKEPSKEEALATTCRQLVQRVQEGNVPILTESLSNISQLDYSAFLTRAQFDCQAIRLLQYAKPASQSYVHSFVFSNSFIDVMPALVVPDDISCSSPRGDPELGKPADMQALPENQEKSWRKIYGFNINAKNNHNFLLKNLTPIYVKFNLPSSGTSGTELRLLAKGDFTNSKTEQILMNISVDRASTRGDAGSLTNALFLLSRGKLDAVLKILYPDNYLEDVCDTDLESLFNDKEQ